MTRYESGGIKSVFQYDNGLPVGYWKWFDRNGGLLKESRFAEGTGYFFDFYKTGQAAVKGKLSKGERSGKWYFWDDSGKLQVVKEYLTPDDYIKTTYRYLPDGSLSDKEVYNIFSHVKQSLLKYEIIEEHEKIENLDAHANRGEGMDHLPPPCVLGSQAESNPKE